MNIEEILEELYVQYKELNGSDHFLRGMMNGYSKEEELGDLIKELEFFDQEKYKYMYEEPLTDEMKELIKKGKELLGVTSI